MGRTCRRLAVHRSHGGGGSPLQSLRRQLPPKGEPGLYLPHGQHCGKGERTLRSGQPRSGCRSTNKEAMRRICRGSLPLKAEIQAILCNPSRPGSQPRATSKDGAGVRGNRYSIPPAAFRRFRRAKAASQAAGRTSGKRREYLCSCAFVWHARAPSVIGLCPLTAPSRREPWNGPPHVAVLWYTAATAVGGTRRKKKRMPG